MVDKPAEVMLTFSLSHMLLGSTPWTKLQSRSSFSELVPVPMYLYCLFLFNFLKMNLESALQNSEWSPFFYTCRMSDKPVHLFYMIPLLHNIVLHENVSKTKQPKLIISTVILRTVLWNFISLYMLYFLWENWRWKIIVNVYLKLPFKRKQHFESL